MTKLLDEVLEEVRKLPDQAQDTAAEFLKSFIANQHEPDELEDETLAAIEEGLAQAKRGEFATDKEMDEIFRRFGK